MIFVESRLILLLLIELGILIDILGDQLLPYSLFSYEFLVRLHQLLLFLKSILVIESSNCVQLFVLHML